MKEKLLRGLKTPADRVLRVACVMALCALPCMVWSVFDPTVWPVMIALSIGQAIGTCSFLLFLFVVARDLGMAKWVRPSPAPAPDRLPREDEPPR